MKRSEKALCSAEEVICHYVTAIFNVVSAIYTTHANVVCAYIVEMDLSRKAFNTYISYCHVMVWVTSQETLSGRGISHFRESKYNSILLSAAKSEFLFPAGMVLTFRKDALPGALPLNGVDT